MAVAAATRLALLLLGCAGLLQSSGARSMLHCPSGWSYYKLSCFKHFAQLRSWDEAEKQCQASQPGAHLAWVQEPHEAATMRMVLSYYQRTQPVWIGLRLGHQGPGWRWVNGAEYSGASGIPRSSGGSGACAALPNVGGFTRWKGTDCAQRHYYLCKVAPTL